MAQRPGTTNVEHFVDKARPIVTKTDMKGIITYANPSFVEISGFTREALIGSPHSIVRHPDMPAEAFKDLWQTVRRGQPWQGMVKNRTADGGFYWVMAFVTPLFENGRQVGFMSVRNAPDRAQVERTGALYAQVLAGEARFPMTPQERQWQRPGLVGTVLGTIGLGLFLGAALLPHWGWSVAGAVWLLAAMMCWRTMISTPMKHSAEALRAIEHGELNHEAGASARFGLGGLRLRIEAVRIHLRSTLCDVMLSARTVEDSVGQVNTTIESLTQTVGAQRDRISQIAAAVEQMSVSIQEASQHTASALALSESALKEVDGAEGKINQSVKGTDSVAQAIGRTSTQVDSLHTLVETITRVTRAISDIASQTSLLSLNAAIEAARAGEDGRGFGVVAGEVRSLSERTATSTVDIGKALEAITHFATDTGKSMRHAVDSVATSGDQIRESAGFFVRVRESSGAVVDRSRQISDMLTQQSSASTEIANSMEVISGEVDRTSDSVAGLGEASLRLRVTAGEIRELLGRYAASL